MLGHIVYSASCSFFLYADLRAHSNLRARHNCRNKNNYYLAYCFFFIYAFLLCFAEVTTVRAVVGGRAHLPCDIEVPSPQRGSDANEGDSNGGISLILWYHGDSHSRGGIPIYSLDARDLPLSRARPFPSAEYNNRAYFDVIARPPLLKIEPVQETDAGEYRCRVDYSRQRTQNRIVYLDVVGKWSEQTTDYTEVYICFST